MSHFSATSLFSELKKSTDEQTALTITKTFEQFADDQEVRINERKKEIIKEINIKDLAT